MLILTSPDMKQSESLPKTGFKRCTPLPKSRKSTIVLTSDDAWERFLRITSVQPLTIGNSIFWRHWTRMRRTVRSVTIWRGERRSYKKWYICEKGNDYRWYEQVCCPLNISCCYYQTRWDEDVSSFFNTSKHTRGFSTSNTPTSTSCLRIYLLRFWCSITWIHRYVLDTQICSCAYFGYRHIHITHSIALAIYPRF